VLSAIHVSTCNDQLKRMLQYLDCLLVATILNTVDARVDKSQLEF
jgi:hypothetical protein